MKHAATLLLIVTFVFLLTLTIPQGLVRATAVTVDSTTDVADGTTSSIAALIASPGADGVISLREAITAANNTSGKDTVGFNIPGAAPFTIQPSTALPVISDPLVIDGRTQPGYSTKPLIELKGGTIGTGLKITGGSSEIYGLAINSFDDEPGKYNGTAIYLNSNNNIVAANYIGTDTSGLVARANFRELYVIGDNNTLKDNVISAGSLGGLYIDGDNNAIKGNTIGADAAGTGDLGNKGNGILIDGDNNIVGGTSPGDGNLIAYNLKDGVVLHPDAGTGNAILSNSIYANGKLGINLWHGIYSTIHDGVTANDSGDVDTGPNDYQNFPVISKATSDGSSSTVVTGTLNSQAGKTYTLQFFNNSSCDSTGYGEGQKLLGATSVTTGSGGTINFTASLLTASTTGSYVTATATDASNNTSEFSHCALVNPTLVTADLKVLMTDQPDPAWIGDNLKYKVTATNGGPSSAMNVKVSDALPSTMTYVSATPSKGTCSESGGTVTCQVQMLFKGDTLTVDILVKPTTAGSITNNVSVSSDAIESTPGDNSASETTTVKTPVPLTLIVNSANDADDGSCDTTHCSLREAIKASNINSAKDTIRFAINSGVQTISPTSALPVINYPVIIDGTTQPGYSGTPLIQLEGGKTSAGVNGLVIAGGGSEVRGLVINRFIGQASGSQLLASAILIKGKGNNLVEKNYIGSDVTGAIAMTNAHIMTGTSDRPGVGIKIDNTADNQIKDNLISANGTGLILNGAKATGNAVTGNTVGLDASGTKTLGNGLRTLYYGNPIFIGGVGIELSSAAGNVIGGTGSGSGNLISGNGSGIYVFCGANNKIQGNLIGTDKNGTSGLPNEDEGISVSVYSTCTSLNLLIGGSVPGARNIISGNGTGVSITGNNVDNSGIKIQGNTIGPDIGGTALVPFQFKGTTYHQFYGVKIYEGDGVIVGGSSPGEGNIISGHDEKGVQITGGDDNVIQGNYIGVDASGSKALPNSSGVLLTKEFGVSNLPLDNLIGGSEAVAGNVISGNKKYGVYIGAGTGNQVQGNKIGTNAAGTAALGNGVDGVAIIAAADNEIGGPAAGEGNLISGNTRIGVIISESTATGNSVQGNLIGTDQTGASALANGQTGVFLQNNSSKSTIGGAAAGAGNTIAFNTEHGLVIATSSNNTIQANTIFSNNKNGISAGKGTGNKITSNSIYLNNQLGIDLAGDGVTANDALDADSGANDLQNFPILNAGHGSSGSVVLSGVLNSLASKSFNIEFYLSPDCDVSGYGEGQNYLGSTTAATDGAGKVSFQTTIATAVPAGKYLTATATGPDDSTSEFSACVLFNRPPVADAGGPYTGKEGVLLTLDGSGSYDPDGDALTYAWTFGDGKNGSGVKPGHIYGDDKLYNVCLTVSDPFGASDQECTTADIANVAPVVKLDTSSQTVQYSDAICTVGVTAKDVAADTLTASTSTLPAGLALTAKGCTVAGDVKTCKWELTGTMDVPAGSYPVTITIGDEDGGSTPAGTAVTVVHENAAISLDPANDIAQQAATPGGDSGPFTLTAYVQETTPDTAVCGADPGDINNAQAEMTLVPVGSGSPVTASCTPAGVSGTGYDAVLQLACNFSGVPVNTYHVQASVAGNYYKGGPVEDVLVVFDPSLGFTSGGGWFYWPGTMDRTSFGYVMKYKNVNGQVKGNLLFIRHLDDGSIYRVKSNALYGLAIGDGEGDPPWAWASFSGKATYLEPGWEEAVGNHVFVVYIEDHGQPGTGDNFWIEILDKDRLIVPALSMDRPAVDHTEPLGGGNLFVPH